MTGTGNPSGRTSDVVLRLVDEVDHERAASALRHENSFLRARLEARGRTEADPGVAAERDHYRHLVGELEGRAAALTGHRDQLADRVEQLEAELRSGQVLAERLTAMEDRLADQARALERFDEMRRLERDDHDARQSAWIAELEQRLDRADEARSDLVTLLGRIDRTPLRHLFRRRAGFRAMEDRWRT